MRSIIRWPGLVAFILISAFIALISIMFMDFWIKLAAEKSLEKTTGAEVNIASVEHSFSPFGVTFHKVQFTDPKHPNNNQLEAESITATIELAPLLLRKLIIDNLSVNKAAFGTERDSEGDVYVDTPESTTKAADIFNDVIEPPSVDELLAKSPLKTTKAVTDTQALYAKHSPILKQQYSTLPTKENLTEYKKRAKALTKTDYKNPLELIEAQKQFKKLKQDVLKDKQVLSEFKEAISQAKSELTPQLIKLKAAPGEDYKQLKSLAAGDPDAINDVTTLIFGDTAAQWSGYALAAFDMLAPMLVNKTKQEESIKTHQGQWINFSDNSSIPDLWIKKANISIQWDQENIESVWSDITHQHDILGKPTIFSIDSKASSLWQSLKLNGDLWLAKSTVKAKQNWQLAGLKLNAMELVNSSKLSSQINQGLLSSNGKLNLNGETLSGNGLIDLTNLAIEASGHNKMTKIVANTLTKLSQLQLNTNIGGTLGDLDLSISSDLNKQIGSALLSNVTPEQQAKLDELKQKLNKKAQGLLGGNNVELAQWLEWEKLVDGDINSLNAIIKSQLNNAIDKQKDKIKDKLLNKLFN